MRPSTRRTWRKSLPASPNSKPRLWVFPFYHLSHLVINYDANCWILFVPFSFFDVRNPWNPELTTLTLDLPVAPRGRPWLRKRRRSWMKLALAGSRGTVSRSNMRTWGEFAMPRFVVPQREESASHFPFLIFISFSFSFSFPFPLLSFFFFFSFSHCFVSSRRLRILGTRLDPTSLLRRLTSLLPIWKPRSAPETSSSLTRRSLWLKSATWKRARRWGKQATSKCCISSHHSFFVVLHCPSPRLEPWGLWQENRGSWGREEVNWGAQGQAGCQVRGDQASQRAYFPDRRAAWWSEKGTRRGQRFSSLLLPFFFPSLPFPFFFFFFFSFCFSFSSNWFPSLSQDHPARWGEEHH